MANPDRNCRFPRQHPAIVGAAVVLSPHWHKLAIGDRSDGEPLTHGCDRCGHDYRTPDPRGVFCFGSGVAYRPNRNLKVGDRDRFSVGDKPLLMRDRHQKVNRIKGILNPRRQ